MLQVENLTRGARLIERGRVADTMWTRFKGLMGVRELAFSLAGNFIGRRVGGQLRSDTLCSSVSVVMRVASQPSKRPEPAKSNTDSQQ